MRARDGDFTCPILAVPIRFAFGHLPQIAGGTSWSRWSAQQGVEITTSDTGGHELSRPVGDWRSETSSMTHFLMILGEVPHRFGDRVGRIAEIGQKAGPLSGRHGLANSGKVAAQEKCKLGKLKA